ncbi:MAG TPA: ATP-binding protein, partial [Campylobacterales bacterium]|nr:ATP-binding protein [Campylobacterales bacterium]
PLNAVLGFTELLRDVDNKTLRDEYLSIIESNGKNLLYIINDILDYSKIESGSFDIEPHSFEAVPEFESVVELFAIKAYEKKIKLLSFIDPHIPKKIIGDSLRIRQILSNLISNAIKFTPEGKNIFINITPGYVKDDKISILFEIKDEGIGIPTDKLERIFTPFSQADAGISRKFGGTGLGLSISSNLASMMGGKLSVESEEGSGSRFWIELVFDVVDTSVDKIDDKSVYIVNLESCGATCMVFAKYLEALGVKWVEAAEEADVIVCYEKMEAGFEGKKKILLTSDPFAYGGDTVRLPLSATKLKKALLGGAENKDEHTKYIDKPHGGAMPEVLVADDNKTNQKLITALFKKHGYEAIIANDGEEAVEL